MPLFVDSMAHSRAQNHVIPDNSLIRKLRMREIFGNCQPYPKQNPKVPSLFNGVIDRLVFQLDKVFPLSALEAGHIFLGFSRCGQFLLTYTYSPDLEVNLLMVSHRYKLHWWRFVPYERAVKVSEVSLFGDNIQDSVKILICYWPNDSSKILVHGTSTSPDIENQNRICYLTITAVPSLSCCKECIRVADSYGEEDLAASWDSCVRFSCLRHGWTVHSSYCTVPPFPNFNPHVSLRKDGSIVINTANFLHVLSAQVKFTNLDTVFEAASTHSITSEPLREEVDIEARSDWEDESVGGSSTQRTPSASSSCVMSNLQKKRLEAEAEYDFIEDPSELPRETISVFRKRRLADKKYEFKDENAENVVPLKMLRRRKGKTSWGAASPNYAPLDRAKEIECGAEWEWSSSSPSHVSEVLRPFNSNVTKSPRCDEEWEDSGEDETGSVCSTSCPASGQTISSRSALPKCVAQFHRRYFEVDDELVSVITDIEEDDLSSSTGYHTALHLEVHGSGYTQMQMVSNAKAEKLNVPHVLVKQLSIDTEQFCHEMAQRLCTLANKKYWFCSDFDVEIIDVSPDSNDVVATAFMLLEADCLNGNKIQRKLCQAGVYFAWNMKTGQHRVIDYDLPDEVTAATANEMSGGNGRWQRQPVRDIARRLRKEATPPVVGLQPAYILTNFPAIRGKSLSVIFDPSRTLAIVLDDPSQ